MNPNLKEFIPDLIQSWNSHDLERILDHYSEDFELTSPIVKKVLGVKNGILKNKNEVREWWQRVLTKVPDLTLELVDIAETADSTVAMIQKGSYNKKNVVSIFSFNNAGKICKEVFYD